MTGVRVKVQRLTSGTTHHADLPDALIHADTLFGRECRTVTPPVAALCGAVLAGTVVVMREHVTVGCRTCARLADRTTAVSR